MVHKPRYMYAKRQRPQVGYGIIHDTPLTMKIRLTLGSSLNLPEDRYYEYIHSVAKLYDETFGDAPYCVNSPAYTITETPIVWALNQSLDENLVQDFCTKVQLLFKNRTGNEMLVYCGVSKHHSKNLIREL